MSAYSAHIVWGHVQPQDWTARHMEQKILDLYLFFQIVNMNLFLENLINICFLSDFSDFTNFIITK